LPKKKIELRKGEKKKKLLDEKRGIRVKKETLLWVCEQDNLSCVKNVM
jgi:hypothetical protein